MAQIKHHLTDALLMGYAAGSLPEAFSLVVATHVSLCDECRARLGAFEAVGGSVVEDAGEAELSEGSFAATLARIAAGPAEPIRVPRPADAVTPGPLADYIGGGLAQVRWQKLGGGVHQAILSTSREATARLLRIPGGVAVPDHGHRGTELTLVLQGAFRDDSDRFARGDVEVADASVEHTPVAEPGADCICLAATDAPLRFNALLPRLVQPFFRI